MTSSTTSQSTSSPLRVGVVGAGKMGCHHLRAIARLEASARVTAVADPAPEAEEVVHGIVPHARLFPSLDELLQHEEVDVVHVCTAPHSHEAVATLALEAGCHVYVEKPFVETEAAARRVLSLARDRGLRVCAGHQLLYEPPTRRALELLPALRDVVHVESWFSFRPVRTSRDGRAAIPPDEQLLDILPHPVYLLLRFLEAAAPTGTTEIVSIEAGPAGTIHARVRRGGISSDLTVTLEGRPVESYVRVVGRNGSVHADYVRGTVQRLIGPGTSGIDKVLNPFRISRQLATGTVTAVASRILGRRRSYPGLVEIFDAFYGALRAGEPSPTSEASLLETARFSERVKGALESLGGSARSARRAPDPTTGSAAPAPVPGEEPLRVLVTGGTGFLGREVVQTLSDRGASVTVLARREPVGWERIPGIAYRVADLGEPLPRGTLRGMDAVVHCAAETAGGWDAHQRNSIDATRNLLEACRADGVEEVVHVSSIAVLAPPEGRGAVREDSPCHTDTRAAGPYVWGKLESERVARELGEEPGLSVRIVRPPALVDYRRFEAPGKLGKTVGNVLVAVGGRGEPLAVVDVCTAARTIAWMVWNPEEAPPVLNLLPESLPSRRELAAELRRTNPDLRVVWLPRLALHPLSWLASGAQKALRPRKPAISVARVFALQRYDNALASALMPAVERYFSTPAPAATPGRSGESRTTDVVEGPERPPAGGEPERTGASGAAELTRVAANGASPAGLDGRSEHAADAAASTGSG